MTSLLMGKIIVGSIQRWIGDNSCIVYQAFNAGYSNTPPVNLTISYQSTQCLPNSKMSCVNSITVSLTQNGVTDTVVVDNKFKAIRNGNPVSEAMLLFPQHTDLLFVKRVSTLFMLIKGFGFKVLFDINRQLTITLEPFYGRVVSVNNM